MTDLIRAHAQTAIRQAILAELDAVFAQAPVDTWTVDPRASR